MSNDRKLIFEPPVHSPMPEMPMLNHVLLTGGTGFIGPFLIKSLLEQTRAKIYVLVRSSDEKQGKQRLRDGMESILSLIHIYLRKKTKDGLHAAIAMQNSVAKLDVEAVMCNPDDRIELAHPPTATLSW